MNRLDGKVCVVTGAAGGIGRAITEEFLSEGAAVALVDVDKEGLDALCRQLDVGERARAFPFDITDSQSVRSGLQMVKRLFGGIDVLVNNAGVERNELLGAISEDSLRFMFEVNVYGTIFMTQYASRIMRQRKCNGAIVNIASCVGISGNPGQSVYSASKGAVIAFTKSAAKELGPVGIRVNAVAPGLTNTSMLDDTSRSALMDRVKRISLGRMAEPKDISHACTFLASNDASFVSGQVLAVDGCQVI